MAFAASLAILGELFATGRSEVRQSVQNEDIAFDRGRRVVTADN
jgi:hypothetical protein